MIAPFNNGSLAEVKPARIAFFMISGLALLHIASLFAGLFHKQADEELPVQTTLDSAGDSNVLLENIHARHLFGIAAEEGQMPEAALNMVLDGVVVSNDPAVSGAYISEAGGPETFYPVRATLPGGATVEDVFYNRVVLRQNGKSETLSFKKSDISGQIVPTLPPGK